MVTIVKATGEKEPFSEEKIIQSIKRAHIPEELHLEALDYIKSKLYEGIPTREIYHHISEFFDKSHHPYAKARYGLKQAIMELGPTGYPFEDFVARIFTEEGYNTQTRVILQGKCIRHEVDVLAKKSEEHGEKTIMVEAKFHNSLGIKTNAKVSMYTKARFDDLKIKHTLHEVWLVTNTKITSDALAYAYCEGVKVISWSYPTGEGIRDLVEKYNLHPITALQSINLQQKQELLAQGIVLCQELMKKPDALLTLGLSAETRHHILREAAFTTNE